MDPIVPTPQPTAPPPPAGGPEHKANWKKWLLTIVAIAALSSLATLIAAASLLTKTPQPTPTPTVSQPTPTPDPTATWKTYTNSQLGYSFQYPSDWEILTEVPPYYRSMLFDPTIPGWKLEDWLNSKMFGDTCRGPILRNTKVSSTLIAFEVFAKSSDGAFCWSSGDFTTISSRTIKILNPPQAIEVNKWRLADYIWPITTDNSGKKYSPEWKGEFFQQIITAENSTHNAIGALVYKDGTDNTAEQIFDQILSTFKFTQ